MFRFLDYIGQTLIIIQYPILKSKGYNVQKVTMTIATISSTWKQPSLEVQKSDHTMPGHRIRTLMDEPSGFEYHAEHIRIG